MLKVKQLPVLGSKMLIISAAENCLAVKYSGKLVSGSKMNQVLCIISSSHH